MCCPLAQSGFGVNRYHNEIEDLKGKIRVYCRVRDGSQPLTVTAPDAHTLCVLDSKVPKEFQFTRVFMPGTSQEQVFAEVHGLVQSAVDGYNITFLSYGESGAGKTHTMLGSGLNGVHRDWPALELPGVVPRVFDELYRCLRAEAQPDFDTSIRCCILELYCGSLRDLLTPNEESLVQLRTTADGAVVVDGACASLATSAAELNQLLQQAMTQQSVLAHRLHQADRSQKAHVAIVLHVSSTHRPTGRVLESKIKLVDLAGYVYVVGKCVVYQS